MNTAVQQHRGHWLVAPEGHPHQVVLEQFTQQALTPFLADMVAEHLERCSDCAAKAKRLIFRVVPGASHQAG